MAEPSQANQEKLVEIHKARDPWQGHLLIGYLQDNGIEAAFQGLPAMPLVAGDLLETSDRVTGIFVIEHDAGRARELIKEFLASENAETESPQPPHPNKERIAELRGALEEERQTFAFLGWAAVVFLAALAVLWAVWPVWLKTEPPAPLYRWTGVALLALASLFALGQTRR
jgi:hypothetical protein